MNKKNMLLWTLAALITTGRIVGMEKTLIIYLSRETEEETAKNIQEIKNNPNTFYILSNPLDGKISWSSLKEIPTLNNIAGLFLDENNAITDEWLCSIAANEKLAQNLKYFSLANNNITDKGATAIAQFTNLNSLHLPACNKISEKGFMELAQLKHLQKLQLNYCENITDKTLLAFSQNKDLCQSLTELSLVNCTKISDKGISYLSKFKNLTRLELSGCVNLTNDALSTISNNSALTILNLDRCFKINNDALPFLEQLIKRRTLKILGLADTSLDDVYKYPTNILLRE